MDRYVVDVALGEGARVAPVAQNHIAGGHGPILWRATVGLILGMIIPPIVCSLVVYLIALAMGGRVGTLVGPVYQGIVFFAQLFGAVLGWRTGEQLGIRQHYRNFLRGLASRGTPSSISTGFRIDDDGFHVDTDRISHRASWTSVLQLFDHPTHWLVQTDTLTIAVPKRMFASPDDEDRFIASLADHMTEPARARSADALESLSARRGSAVS